MHKAKKLLPELEKGAVHLTKEWNNHHNPGRIRSGIEELTNYTENDKAEWIISINEKGKELLRWFRENES